jgi:8-oxo-dGTP diphosphatase
MGAKEQGTDAQTTQGRWQVIPRTLCFVTHGEDILLMKRGPHKRIFPNHYNGLGGHIERDEDPLSGARREIKEESGLEVAEVRYCGTTHIDAGQNVGIILFIFSAKATSRETQPNEEGTLEWIHLPTLLDEMATGATQRLLVEDLPILLPRIFGDGGKGLKTLPIREPFFAHVSYTKDDSLRFVVGG